MAQGKYGEPVAVHASESLEAPEEEPHMNETRYPIVEMP